MMNLKALVILGMFFTVPVRAETYAIKIPQTNLTCEQEATRLAQRFEMATKIRAFKAICKGIVKLTSDKAQYTLYSLELQYKGESLRYSAYYSTSSDELGEPNDEVGLYTSYSDCLAQLSTQTRAFESQTGLVALAATCQPGAFEFTPSYVLRVDGFGVPQRRLRSQAIKYLGATSNELLRQSDQMMTSMGATIITRAEDRIIFYAPDSLRFSQDHLATLESKSQCEAQQNTARAMYAKFGSQGAVVSCLPESAGAGGPYYLEALREGNYFLQSDYGTAHSRYYSFEECMADAALVNATASQAGYCHTANPTGTEYELEVYSVL